MLGIIKRNFKKYISINSVTVFYSIKVGLWLDHSWIVSQYGYIIKRRHRLEKVQKKATKIIPEIRFCHTGNVLKHVSCQRYISDKSEDI